MTTAALTSFELLVLALDGGTQMAQAAALARMRSAEAVREARAIGWPDKAAVAEAAAEIRERHPAPADPVLPGGDTVPPRTKHRPVPIEPDVEAALARGAAAIEETRAAMAPVFERDVVERLERDAAADVPEDLDRVVDRTDDLEAARLARTPEPCAEAGQPQPAAEATDAPVGYVPCDECETTGHNCPAHRTPPTERDEEALTETSRKMREYLAPERQAIAAYNSEPATTATLATPLATLTNADGQEFVLVEGVVHVMLLPDRLAAIIDDPTNCSLGAPICWTAERRITEAGRQALDMLGSLA